ncbi:MAG: ion channel [Nitriliruptor sp.]|uniref:ion channel n=1 Tax=Nitriliruptor sp. TaxID=2448056 RepID=UPI0034A07A6D
MRDGSRPTVFNGGAARRLWAAVLTLAASTVLFSVGFKLLMAAEGRAFGWASSLYWTVVTMSTLGYGDIVFESELGRLYSVIVLGVGALLFLALLPFVLIQFGYLPWVRAVRHSRTPRSLPPQTADHLILVGHAPLQECLIRRARAARQDHVILVEDLPEAVQLRKLGYPVVVGPLDDPQTYRRIRAETASLVFTASKDTTNTNVAFTMREAARSTLLISTASSPDAADILRLAGCDEVFQPGEYLGEQFARRILAPAARSSVIAGLGGISVAQVSAAGTDLIGQNLGAARLRRRVGLLLVLAHDASVARRQHRRGHRHSQVILLALGVMVTTPGVSPQPDTQGGTRSRRGR